MISNKKMISFVSLALAALFFILAPNLSWAAPDRDGDGFRSNVDCNDRDGTIYPGAPELCDGKDNQCDGDNGFGTVDEGCVACTDVDGDTVCLEDGDCDDNDPTIYPGAPELCDGKDNQCDGDPGYGDEDEGCPICTDDDGDGYFAENDCDSVPDCDDSNKDVYPGAPELCDGIDNQCSGDSGYGFTDEVCTACEDGDGDNFFNTSGCGPLAVDCDDALPLVNPDATEDCNTPYDDNCNNQINEGCGDVGTDTDGDWLSDQDENDGFALAPELEFYDENTNSWKGGSDFDGFGAAGCPANDKCLDPGTQDVFVLVRLLANSQIEVATIFELSSKPVTEGGAGQQMWVVREKAGQPLTTRIFAPGVSDQKCAIFNESAELGGSAAGLSQPGTIMTEGQGNAWIKTLKIENDVESNCPADDSCELNGEPQSPAAITEAWYKRTASHEVRHVHKALNTDNLHGTDDTKLMSPAVIFTQKNNKPGKYYIGEQVSDAALNDFKFR